LHPDHGPRGQRIFDPDEVDKVAERIARSGRALDGDGPDFIERRNVASRVARPGSDSGKTARLHDALNEIVRLKHLVHQATTEHADWVSRTQEAVDGVNQDSCPKKSSPDGRRDWVDAHLLLDGV
jgi:hypothetical protein